MVSQLEEAALDDNQFNQQHWRRGALATLTEHAQQAKGEVSAPTFGGSRRLLVGTGTMYLWLNSHAASQELSCHSPSDTAPH